MNILELIEVKKKGGELSKTEIEFFIQSVVDGSVPDYQIAALLMAIRLNGMTEEETFALTAAMTQSGKVLKKDGISGVVADKHSTGGVSDSTTLIVVPVCICLGLKFAKLSGRGLGHTGGTLDKLESFEGFNVSLTPSEFMQAVEKTGGAIAGQTEETCPSDKKLYALRDVTGTIDSIPLIASSVMCKKLASFSDVILLDVKYGSGAFMKSKEDAEKLAELMVKIGRNAKRKVGAVISNMNEPLTGAVGCNLEIREVLFSLMGKDSRLLRLSKRLCVELLRLNGEKDAEEKVDEAIKSGAAFNKLKEIVANQNGSTEFFNNPEKIPLAKYEYEFKACKSGFLIKADAETIGKTCVLLGGGRMRKDDVIDHAAGLNLAVSIGDRIEKGQTLATLYSSKTHTFFEAERLLSYALEIGESEIKSEPLIYKVL